jgi:pimeloyl-ACP methyl ester carboxylesterase
VGNSIGGGLSAGAAASLGKKICRGLVLLNTAGVLIDPDTYAGYDTSEIKNEFDSDINSYTKAAIEGNPEEVYSPVPIFGNKALDVFGSAIVGLIYPQIEKRLSLIYGNRIENADPSVVYAIQQGASSPGSANVIGCGQKLAPNRPLNEVLLGVGEVDGQNSFPTLVVMGLDDRVSSPQVAKFRAEIFSRLNPDTVTLKEIADAGHCPHDETPEKVANYMLKWLDSSQLLSTSGTTARIENDATVCNTE